MKKLKYLLVGMLLCTMLNGCSTNKDNKHDNVLTVGVDTLSGTFHPAYSATVYDFYVSDLIYDSLLSKDKEGNMIPNLATSLPVISEDYKSFSFTLKDEYFFSNGKKVTSEDVAFSFTMLADPSYDGRYANVVAGLEGYENYNQGDSENITGIEVIDETHITFHFKEGNSDNLNTIANLGISSKQEYPHYEKGNLEEIKQKLTTPIGSGPYELKNYTSQDGVALQRNSKDKRSGYEIENVILKPVEAGTKFESLKKGEIDVLVDFNDPSLIQQGSKESTLKHNEYEKASLNWLTFNCANNITSDVSVRKALTLALDREQFVEHAFACDDCKNINSISYVPQIFQNPMSSLREYVLGNKEVKGLEDNKFNMDEAKRILDENGWVLQSDGIRYKEGKPLQIKMLIANEFKYTSTLISLLNKHWKETLGVDLRIAQIDFNALIAKLMDPSASEEFDAFIISSTFNSANLGNIYSIFHSSTIGQDNFAKVNHPDIDALLEKGKKTFDKEELEAIYLELAVLIHNQYANIPMYGAKGFDFYTKQLENFTTNSYYPWTKALKDAKFA